jgi:hypothetical protein
MLHQAQLLAVPPPLLRLTTEPTLGTTWMHRKEAPSVASPPYMPFWPSPRAVLCCSKVWSATPSPGRSSRWRPALETGEQEEREKHVAGLGLGLCRRLRYLACQALLAGSPVSLRRVVLVEDSCCCSVEAAGTCFAMPRGVAEPPPALVERRVGGPHPWGEPGRMDWPVLLEKVWLKNRGPCLLDTGLVSLSLSFSLACMGLLSSPACGFQLNPLVQLGMFQQFVLARVQCMKHMSTGGRL